MGSNTNTGMQYIYSAPTNIDSCIGTCENGGTWSTDMCACDCTPGYTGNLCTSQCSTQCNNGAAVNESNCECICNEKQFGSKCNCRYPFTGGNCNTCKHVTCENNGVFNAISCRCECLPGYGGLRCDVTCADTGDNATCTAGAAAGNCISDNVNMEQTCMVSCNLCVEQSPSAVPSTTTSSGSNFRNYDLEIIIILIPVGLLSIT
ncbi:uncharacterized protein LOC143066307 [Mytilus galloprovincialis]|uniref:uncharacterized protein LOC143066307 n=1 Tax=Mytilus galloprovincialis TaxID=29158 RepID=UPI003F7CA3CC